MENVALTKFEIRNKILKIESLKNEIKSKNAKMIKILSEIPRDERYLFIESLSEMIGKNIVAKL